MSTIKFWKDEPSTRKWSPKTNRDIAIDGFISAVCLVGLVFLIPAVAVVGMVLFDVVASFF